MEPEPAVPSALNPTPVNAAQGGHLVTTALVVIDLELGTPLHPRIWVTAAKLDSLSLRGTPKPLFGLR